MALSAGLLLTGCIGGNFGMPFQKTVDESRPLAANGVFELENTNGSVRLTTWDEPRVRIEAVKHAGSERALEELKVEIVGEGDRLSVRTRYPRPHWMGGAGRVDYRVSVPRGARVRVRQRERPRRGRGRRGGLKAETVNGSVDVTDAGGAVEASAVNGSVEVEVARVDPAGRSRLATTNGSVRLTLPRDASAEVEAHTVNGERQLRLRPRRLPRRAAARSRGGSAPEGRASSSAPSTARRASTGGSPPGRPRRPPRRRPRARPGRPSRCLTAGCRPGSRSGPKRSNGRFGSSALLRTRIRARNVKFKT